MKVVILPDVWTDLSIPVADVVTLCRLADRACHALLTWPLWDDEPAHPVYVWRSAQADDLLDEVVAMFKRGLLNIKSIDRPGTPTIWVTTGTTRWADGVLSVETAIEFLQMPLKIVLENRDNDREFLRKMALPGERRALDRALDQRWVEVENGNGFAGVESWFRRTERPSRDGEWRERLRAWYLFDRDVADRDLTAPGEKNAKLAEALTPRQFDSWEPRGHMLKRREAENYVPVAILDAWWAPEHENASHKLNEREVRKRRRKVTAYANLPREIRQAMDMKKGLAQDIKSEERRKEVRSLRAPLTREDLSDRLSDAHLQLLFGGQHNAALDLLRVGFNGLHGAWRVPDGVVDAAFETDASVFDEVEVRDLHHERVEMLESLLSRL